MSKWQIETHTEAEVKSNILTEIETDRHVDRRSVTIIRGNHTNDAGHHRLRNGHIHRQALRDVPDIFVISRAAINVLVKEGGSCTYPML